MLITLFVLFIVQEQMITSLTRTLPEWLSGYGYNGWVDQAFAYLPSSMEMNTLVYPTLITLFEDLAVHRLCSFAGMKFNVKIISNIK